MTKVLIFGTFDGLHQGHRDFFKQAREFGEYVVAIVARDSTVQQNKNKQPKYNEQERKKALEESGLVSEVILGQENHNTEKSQYQLIQEIMPDVVCLGYDQARFKEKLKEELLRIGLKDVQIKISKPFEPEKYHSSILNKY